MEDGRLHFVSAETAKIKSISLSDENKVKSHTKTSFKSSNRRKSTPSKKQYPILTRKEAPSVPTKYQQNGYVESADGKLRPQDPLPLGFSGLGSDTAGPGDYDPQPLPKHTSAPTLFPRKTRESIATSKDWMGVDRLTEIPGPGQYNSRSMFDEDTHSLIFETEEASSPTQRKNAAFKSGVKREFPLPKATGDAFHEPGPASYNIPSALKVSHKPTNQQCFSSTSTRFNNPIPRSQRLSTAPGQYSYLTSDFDINNRNISRQKKLIKSSTWAASVSFTTTSSRFQHMNEREMNPSPLDYEVKTGTISGELERRLSTSKTTTGPFGTTSKRFYDPNNDPERRTISSAPLSALPPQVTVRAQGGPSSRSLSHDQELLRQRAAKVPSSFFKSSDVRIQREVPTDGPPVGSYNIRERERARGVIPMIPPSPTVQKPPSPGPGDYNIPSPMKHSVPNRKHILLTTGERFEYKAADGPGPGAYDPTPLHGSLITHSHNINYLQA